MLSPTYEITTALSHTDELISPPYDIAIVTISYGRVIMSSVWDSMMSKKNVGWPFYAAVGTLLIGSNYNDNSLGLRDTIGRHKSGLTSGNGLLLDCCKSDWEAKSIVVSTRPSRISVKCDSNFECSCNELHSKVPPAIYLRIYWEYLLCNCHAWHYDRWMDVKSSLSTMYNYIFVCEVNIWNVNHKQAVAFILDWQMGVVVKVLKPTIQSSTAIPRSNNVKCYINNYRIWGRLPIKCWIHNQNTPYLALMGALWGVFC